MTTNLILNAGVVNFKIVKTITAKILGNLDGNTFSILNRSNSFVITMSFFLKNATGSNASSG